MKKFFKIIGIIVLVLFLLLVGLVGCVMITDTPETEEVTTVSEVCTEDTVTESATVEEEVVEIPLTEECNHEDIVNTLTITHDLAFRDNENVTYDIYFEDDRFYIDFFYSDLDDDLTTLIIDDMMYVWKDAISSFVDGNQANYTLVKTMTSNCFHSVVTTWYGEVEGEYIIFIQAMNGEILFDMAEELLGSY